MTHQRNWSTRKTGLKPGKHLVFDVALWCILGDFEGEHRVCVSSSIYISSVLPNASLQSSVSEPEMCVVSDGIRLFRSSSHPQTKDPWDPDCTKSYMDENVSKALTHSTVQKKICPTLLITLDIPALGSWHHCPFPQHDTRLKVAKTLSQERSFVLRPIMTQETVHWFLNFLLHQET